MICLNFLAMMVLVASGYALWTFGNDPIPYNDEDQSFNSLILRLHANIKWLLPKSVAYFPEPFKIRKVRVTQSTDGMVVEPLNGSIWHLKSAMSKVQMFLEPNPDNQLLGLYRFDLSNVNMEYHFNVKTREGTTSRTFKWQFGGRSRLTITAAFNLDKPCLMQLREASSFDLVLTEGKGQEPRIFLQNYMLPILNMRMKQILQPVKFVISRRICQDITEWMERSMKKNDMERK